MVFMGSKKRLAKHILPIILKDRKPDQWFVEPFCGGCNITSNVEGKRIANDLHSELIQMWIALVCDGWKMPSHITEEQYRYIKENQDRLYTPLVSFVGYACSFGSKYFGGYGRSTYPDGIRIRNVCLGSKKGVLKQIPKLQGVVFKSVSYEYLTIPKDSIVYCDPHYAGKTKYKTTGKFDYNKFWRWVRYISKFHTVFVSEYTAPDDFRCVWSKSHFLLLQAKDNISVDESNVVERLFVYNG